MFDYGVIDEGRLNLCTRVDGDAYYLGVYSSMTHIDDIRPDQRVENQQVSRISQVAEGLPRAADFTITRLHRHFDLQLRERLVETSCQETGAPVLRPTEFSDAVGYLPTSFKFFHGDQEFVEAGRNDAVNFLPLEFREVSTSEEVDLSEWLNSDRVRVMGAVGSSLLRLGLSDKFGLAIGTFPNDGRIWVERTYLKDRSHHLTLER